MLPTPVQGLGGGEGEGSPPRFGFAASFHSSSSPGGFVFFVSFFLGEEVRGGREGVEEKGTLHLPLLPSQTQTHRRHPLDQCGLRQASFRAYGHKRCLRDAVSVQEVWALCPKTCCAYCGSPSEHETGTCRVAMQYYGQQCERGRCEA